MFALKVERPVRHFWRSPTGASASVFACHINMHFSSNQGKIADAQGLGYFFWCLFFVQLSGVVLKFVQTYTASPKSFPADAFHVF